MSELFRDTVAPAPSSGGRDRFIAGVFVALLASAGTVWWGWQRDTAPPQCVAGEEGTLGEGEAAIPCDDARWALRYVEAVSARTLGSSDRRRIYDDLRLQAEADRVAVIGSLGDARAFLEGIRGLPPLAAAEARAAEAWEVQAGEGVFSLAAYPEVSDTATRSLGVWSVDDEERLVLTEMDVEGWIRYASLCREVQGGGAVRVSVADRVAIYREIQETFEEQGRDGKIAMTAVGPFWTSTRMRWQQATYEGQQKWIQAAPLPPPMTATSLGYIAAVMEEDVRQHVRVLHEVLGPLDMDVVR
jgi:hypothetical protein